MWSAVSVRLLWKAISVSLQSPWLGDTCHVVSAATGKTTFLRLLEEKSPSYHVVSEPLSKWQSVEDTQVRKLPPLQVYLPQVVRCVCAAGDRVPTVWK